MKSQVQVSSATTSNPIPVDYLQTPFSVGFGVSLGGGVMTFKVQHTFDNPFDPTITPTWFDHPTVTGKTADTDGNYAAPVRAIRLNVTAWTSGTATMNVLQGTTS
jgi:hypothetical protein